MQIIADTSADNSKDSITEIIAKIFLAKSDCNKQCIAM